MNPYPVDPDLYAELRRYCDDQGLRFVDFMEEALDNAVRRDEILRQSAETQEHITRIERVRRKAYFRGFWCGMIAGLLSASDNRVLLDHLMPAELEYEQAAPPPIPQQQQLLLFDD